MLIFLARGAEGTHCCHQLLLHANDVVLGEHDAVALPAAPLLCFPNLAPIASDVAANAALLFLRNDGPVGPQAGEHREEEAEKAQKAEEKKYNRVHA